MPDYALREKNNRLYSYHHMPHVHDKKIKLAGFLCFFTMLLLGACKSDEQKIAEAEAACAKKKDIDHLDVYFYGYFPGDADSLHITIKRKDKVIEDYTDVISPKIQDSLRHERYYSINRTILLTDTVFIKLKNEAVKKVYGFKYLINPHFTMMNSGWGCDFDQLIIDGKMQKDASVNFKKKGREIIEREDFERYYKPISVKTPEIKTPVIYTQHTIAIKDVLINHHKIIQSMSEFNSRYQYVDSSKTALWECGNPLEWLDEKWMRARYGAKSDQSGTFKNYDGNVTTLYGKDIEFNTNSHVVLFNTAFAKSNSFEIPSHNIVLDKNTSMEDFQKLFPNSKMEKLEESNEVRFRFYIKSKADDCFLIYFKRGKLNYFKLWWLLC